MSQRLDDESKQKIIDAIFEEVKEHGFATAKRKNLKINYFANNSPNGCNRRWGRFPICITIVSDCIELSITFSLDDKTFQWPLYCLDLMKNLVNLVNVHQNLGYFFFDSDSYLLYYKLRHLPLENHEECKKLAPKFIDEAITAYCSYANVFFELFMEIIENNHQQSIIDKKQKAIKDKLFPKIIEQGRERRKKFEVMNILFPKARMDQILNENKENEKNIIIKLRNDEVLSEVFIMNKYKIYPKDQAMFPISYMEAEEVKINNIKKCCNTRYRYLTISMQEKPILIQKLINIFLRLIDCNIWFRDNSNHDFDVSRYFVNYKDYIFFSYKTHLASKLIIIRESEKSLLKEYALNYAEAFIKTHYGFKLCTPVHLNLD